VIGIRDIIKKIVCLIGFGVIVWFAFYWLRINANDLFGGLIQKDVFEESDVFKGLSNGIFQIYVSIFLYLIIKHVRPLFKRPVLILNTEMVPTVNRKKIFFGLLEQVGTGHANAGWKRFNQILLGGCVLLFGYMVFVVYSNWSKATVLYIIMAILPVLFLSLAAYVFKDTYLYMFKDFIQQKGHIYHAVDITEVLMTPEGDGSFVDIAFHHSSTPYHILLPVEYSETVFDLFKAYEAYHERPLTPFEQVPDLIVNKHT
jgi:hypothetical protein